MTRLDLKLIHPLPPLQDPSKNSAVHVNLSLEKGHLRAHFRVTAPALVTNPALPLGSPQWGLWDWDVVELFLRSPLDPSRYWEFQISPLGQIFELEILEPRKRWNQEYRSGWKAEAQIKSDKKDAAIWEATMIIPWKWASATGNAFAILGPEGAKTYWSLFLPPQEEPNYHLPEFFKPLL